MMTGDDRLWKAEELLREVVEHAAGGSSSTRDRIERFFDAVDTAAHEAVTATLRSDVEEPVSPAALPEEPPVAVPNHELIRCLGAGGFGQVWLARHAVTEHYRACKLIPADKAIELDGLRRLKQHVPAHPNLFPIEEVGTVEGWLYCLMPLADAASADQAVFDHALYRPLTLKLHLERHGRRPTAEVAAIGRELAGAVRHLHEHGVTHGDIKPGNIMRLGGRWTLADYGLARDLSAPIGQSHTPGYVPPEGPGSPAADQFALGVVLMELLTNRPAGTLRQFHDTPIERFKLDGGGRRMAGIIRRATAGDPGDRFGSIDELIASLGAVVPRPAPVRRTPWLLAAPLVATLGAVAIIVLLNRPSPTSPDPGTGSVAPALVVESFEIRRYRYDEETDTTRLLGAISADEPVARAGDYVTVHGRFSGLGNYYLVALDSDGGVRLCLPESPTAATRPANRFDYPSDPVADPEGWLYNLDTGPGTQGFMLLASRDPLPAWVDWIAGRGEPTWTREALPADAAILFDGVRMRQLLPSDRGPAPRPAPLVLGTIDWIKAQQGFEDVRLLAFPVRPAPKLPPSDEN